MNTERSPIKSPPHPIVVGASLLSADWARLGEEARGVLDAGADLLHIDVMDGHFVPNLAFGPDACVALRAAVPGCYLDVHLMVEDPGHFVPVFAEAGADFISFHAEVLEPAEAVDLAAEVRELGCEVGLAINPPTAVEPWLEVASGMDMLLVMSVNPGYSGQKFIASVLEKVSVARRELGAGMRIQLDGGVGPEVADEVIAAGGDVLAAASAIFRRPEAERGEVIRRLRGGTAG